VVNASNIDKDLEWIKSHAPKTVEVTDESTRTVLLSLQGPLAETIMVNTSDAQSIDLTYMQCKYMRFGGKMCLVSRTGYTGADGFEIYVDREDASDLFDVLLRVSRRHGCMLAGLGARDILRIEAGYCLYGNELDESTNPIEASLDWAVKIKQKDFSGKAALLKAIADGIKRRRVGFTMEDASVPRKGYLVYSDDEYEIGTVSSGTYSPNLNQFIGMGYVSVEYTKPYTPIKIRIRNRFYRAHVNQLPFIVRHK
jgi:aminomethyltransferase